MPCRNPNGDGEGSCISIWEFNGEIWVGNINLSSANIMIFKTMQTDKLEKSYLQ